MPIRFAAFAGRGLKSGVVLCLMVLLAACGPANTIGVQYHGYSIAPSQTSIKAGNVNFNTK